MSRGNTEGINRLRAAIDTLAEQVPSGALLAETDPCALLLAAAEQLRLAKAEQIVSRAQNEELRRKVASAEARERELIAAATSVET
jgi:hypothetical protein